MTKDSAGKQLQADARSQCRVLVPGCGTGYDVAYFAHKLGYGEVVGADIAPEAIEAAKAWYDKTYGLVETTAGLVHFQTADYLGGRDDSLGQFDLVYDYTFFCALPLSLRPRWAEAHARTVKSGGYLLCLVYPIHGDRQGGPPVSRREMCGTQLIGNPLTYACVHPLHRQYSVSPDHYTLLLSDNFTLEFEGLPSDQPESRKGVESVMLWRRK